MLFSGSAEAVNFPKNSGNKLCFTPPGSFLKLVFCLGVCPLYTVYKLNAQS